MHGKREVVDSLFGILTLDDFWRYTLSQGGGEKGEGGAMEKSHSCSPNAEQIQQKIRRGSKFVQDSDLNDFWCYILGSPTDGGHG